MSRRLRLTACKHADMNLFSVATLARAWLTFPHALASVATAILIAAGVARVSESTEYQVSDQPTEAPAHDPIRDAFAGSYKYENAGKYEQAIKALEPVRGISQQQYLLSLRLGWLHYLNGDHENAGEHYRSAIEAAPTATEPRVGYLLPLLAQHRYDEAETVARKALEIDPKNYYANLRLAHALRKQDKLADAAQVASRMLELQPTDVSVLAELALIYDTGGQQDEAREVFEKILMLAPNNALARERLGLPDPQPASDLGDPAVTSSAASVRGDYCCPGYPRATSVSPYYAYLDYGSESVKSHGNTWGVYGSLSALNSLEAGYE